MASVSDYVSIVYLLRISIPDSPFMTNAPQAHIISENGRHFVQTRLMPADTYCYMYRLFEKYGQKQYGKIEVREGKASQ